MIISRRLALIASVVVLGVSACGDPNGSTNGEAGSQPKIIRIGAATGANGGSSAAPAAGSVESDRMMMPVQDIVYVVDGTLPSMPGQAQAWLLPAGQQPDLARVRAIATALGVDGDVQALPAEQGGGWLVGPADYSGPNLGVSADGMLSWWFSPVIAPQVREGCVMPAEIDPIDNPAPDVEGETKPLMPPECLEPVPPVGVPTGEEATEKAKALFAEFGYDLAQFEFDVYADEWSASVTAYRMLGGLRSPMTLSAGYGENGALTWAGGFLGEPVAQGDYPLVSVDEALARLQDQQFWWGVGPMARDTLGGVVGSNGDIAVGAPEPMPLPPECDPAADCIIEPMPDEMPIVDTVPLEPYEVHINGVRPDLSMQWSDDGSIWMVPAFTFTSTDGGLYTVIAVTDDLIDLPGEDIPVDTVPVDTVTPPVDTVVVPPVDTIEPPPVVDDPGTVTPETQAVADSLIGLSLEEAEKVVAEAGLVVRVVSVDGVTDTVTADQRTDRINVSVTNGIVTASGVY
jgi:hypothetical protein